MELYCWGNTSRGQLGLGGIEDEQVSSDRNVYAQWDLNGGNSFI